MCLGVPGKVVRWIEREEPFARAEVEFGGVRREVGMDCMTDAVEGDYVIVHAGVAISLIEPGEAERTLRMLAEMGELQEQGLTPGGSDEVRG